jgi:hypothetical protein
MFQEEVLELRWPNGDPVLTAAQALDLVRGHVGKIILDVKVTFDKVRWANNPLTP